MDKKETVDLDQVSIGISQEDIDNLIKDLSKIISDKKVTTANILSVITQLMVAAAKYPNLSGSQKKELVIYVTRKFIEDSKDLDENTKLELLTMFDTIIPTAIDLLVAASKSKFAFKIKKKLLSCCS